MYHEISVKDLEKFQPKKLKEHTISPDDYTDSGFMTSCTITGGFIVFGGWIKIFPGDILGDGINREAYCAMGGLGISVYHDTGTFMCSNGGCPEGKWWTPRYVYEHTASVMAYAASEANPEGEILFFDSGSNIIAAVKPDTSRSPFIGGGTVNWEKA